MFTKELKQQALQHVRHRVKRDVEMRIDMKFTSINALENHMVELVSEINPRGLYDQLCREFHIYEDNNDYASILRVYNQKQMLNDSNVATLGLKEALRSPLFTKIRAAKALGWEHTGGCTLYEHRDEVEAMLD
jgi:hypothetical protein